MRIIVLFNLKEGVNPVAYEAWAKGTDIPGVNMLSSVEDFTVHRATGMFGSDATPPYQYIEVIDLHALEPCGEEISTDAFQAVAAAFGDYADNPQFILTENV